MTATEQTGDSEPEGKEYKQPRPDDLRNLLLRGRPTAYEGADPPGAETQPRDRGWGTRGDRTPASVEGDWVQPRRRDGDDGSDEGGDAEAGTESDSGWTRPRDRREADAGDADAAPDARADDRASTAGPDPRSDDQAASGSRYPRANDRGRFSPRDTFDGRGRFGTSASPAADLDYESCEHCGAVLDDDSDYCPSCGRLAEDDDGAFAAGGSGAGSGFQATGFRRFGFERAGAATPTAAAGVPASHGRRIVAYIIDAIIALIILSVVYPRLMGEPYVDVEAISDWIEQTTTQIEENAQGNQTGASDDVVAIPRTPAGQLTLPQVVLNILYFGVLQGVVGYTVGKRVMGIAIVNAKGAPIGIPLGILRSIGYSLSMLFLPIMLIILVHPQRRALHDMISGAYAIQAEPATQTIDET